MITGQRKPGSPLGAHSTADDVLAGRDLAGATALVTGGYSGLGLATTRALVRAGAHVVVPARRPDTAEADLRGVPRTEVHALDLADLGSVRVFAERFLETGRPLHLLINGAGVMACPETARTARTVTSPNRPPPRTCSSGELSPGSGTPTRRPSCGTSPVS